ncbi:MAG: dockerin type I domain-containing protein [Nanobdellota archaeon]
MVWKVGKTLKNLLYAGTFATAATILPSCEKEPDPEPPKPPVVKSIEQSVNLNNDVEIKYSATLSNVDKAQLNIKKEGVSIATEQINDATSTGLDYQKTYTYAVNPNITKGNYEFTLTAGDLQKNNSVQIQNYKPTGNFSGINLDMQYNSEVNVTLPTPSDKNPEDNPVPFANVKSLDDKTSVTLNGNNLKVKSLSGNTGSYQIEVEYGSANGGLEKSVLNGNIAGSNKIQVNLLVQPNDSTLNWYGSGDVDNNNTRNSQDLDRMIEIINGVYSNPNDRRLYDRADVNGDEKVNSEDLDILTKRINGVRLYLPGEWNMLLTRAEKIDWLTKMFAIDLTDEIAPFPGWDCTQYMDLVYINFHGVDVKEIPYINKIYPYDFSDNCRFNIPVYQLTMTFYDSNNQILDGHGMNTVFLEKDYFNWTSKLDIEPQFDHLNVAIGEDYLDGKKTIAWVRGPPVIKVTDISTEDGISMIAYIMYKINNDIPSFYLLNYDVELVDN